MARIEARAQLASLFLATGEFNAVFAYKPSLLGEAQTKVLCVYTDRTSHIVDSAHLRNDFYTFYLDILVKRANDGSDEDSLDDLHEVVRATVRENIGNNPQWSALSLENTSRAFFAEISGVGYRIEQLTLQVKVTGS